MIRSLVHSVRCLVWLTLGTGVANAQSLPDSTLFAGMQWRWLGPSHPSGRIVAIAGVDTYAGSNRGRPGTTLYVAAATGGVWKTSNGGTTWTSVFEHVGSIGDVAVAPSDPGVVWVGTGEANSQRSSSYGNGLYKSTDSGKTWTHMGLPETGHIGRIMIHPKDTNIVYIASPGPLWKDGGERGVFKTTDGGRTWENVLTISEHTGVIDVVLDPSRPERLYAAAYQRQRKTWGFVAGGVESGLYRSTDGGRNWTKVTSGMPTGEVGRIALAVSPVQPNRVYAVIEAPNEQAGTFRSDDAGETWKKVSGGSRISNYNASVRADPVNADRVYVIGTGMYVSSDAGATFQSGPFTNGPGDCHAIWIDPSDNDHLVSGSDPGLHISYDGGKYWALMPNLPNTQVYAMAVSNARPYMVCIGLQDFSNYCGPASTRENAGILASDWRLSGGGDGGGISFDPTDPQIIFLTSPYGDVARYDLRTGAEKLVAPLPKLGDTVDRWNWTAPVVVSTFDHLTIYTGGSRIYRSRDGGMSWERASGDLTRNQSRDTLKIMGRAWPPTTFRLHASTAIYGNISALDESPLDRNVLYTGTDDGVLSVTRDGGKSWKKLMNFPGVPDETYVSRVIASRSVRGRLYATFDNHRRNDFKPYVLRSDDYGATWQNISSNLPAFGSVYVVREHPRNANLLVVGTEMGVFVSTNGGSGWRSLRSNMPAVPVHDLVFQERENDLVVGTHGRGVYVMDDITPLEKLAEAERLATGSPKLFTPRAAYVYVPAESKIAGSKLGVAFTGHAWAAENPPFGVTITYYVPTDPGTNASLSIRDASGAVVRELPLERGPGLHRVTWDLELTPTYTPPTAPRRPVYRERGVLAIPGRYRARLRIGSANTSAGEVDVVLLRDTLWRGGDAAYRAMHAAQVNAATVAGRLAKLNYEGDSLRKMLAPSDTGASAGRPLSPAVEPLVSELDDLLSMVRSGYPKKVAESRPSYILSVQDREPLAEVIRQTSSSMIRWLVPPTATELNRMRDASRALAGYEKQLVTLQARANALTAGK
jgi:photosystem II stability/assembly factor-like uncharacterized protein